MDLFEWSSRRNASALEWKWCKWKTDTQFEYFQLSFISKLNVLRLNSDAKDRVELKMKYFQIFSGQSGSNRGLDVLYNFYFHCTIISILIFYCCIFKLRYLWNYFRVFSELYILVIEIGNFCCFILRNSKLSFFMTNLEYPSLICLAKPVRLHIIDIFLLPLPTDVLKSCF